MAILEKLKYRVELWGNSFEENDVGELTHIQKPLKSLWANIRAQGGNIVNLKGNCNYSDVFYKFTVRDQAVKGITEDMFFKWENNRYFIRYIVPSDKFKNCLEILCNLETKEGVDF